MVTTELIPNRRAWCPTVTTGAVIGLTALGVGLAIADPALAGSTEPHPTLTGSLGDAISIVETNARVLAAPFLLVLLGFPHSRLGRHAGDLIVLALVAASTISVGLELGRWQDRLLPYLPQLPLEWAALALAVNAWAVARSGHITVAELAPLVAVILVLLVGAASIETWATPHRRGHRLQAVGDTAMWRAVSRLSPGFCTGPGPVASRSQAPFPSLRSVPLGRLAGAAGTSSTNRPPQGGIT